MYSSNINDKSRLLSQNDRLLYVFNYHVIAIGHGVEIRKKTMCWNKKLIDMHHVTWASLRSHCRPLPLEHGAVQYQRLLVLSETLSGGAHLSCIILRVTHADCCWSGDRRLRKLEQ